MVIRNIIQSAIQQKAKEVLGDVEAEPEAGLVNVREPVDNGASRLVGDVEQDMVVTRALHLAVDRAGHDVAWGE